MVGIHNGSLNSGEGGGGARGDKTSHPPALVWPEQILTARRHLLLLAEPTRLCSVRPSAPRRGQLVVARHPQLSPLGRPRRYHTTGEGERTPLGGEGRGGGVGEGAVGSGACPGVLLCKLCVSWSSSLGLPELSCAAHSVCLFHGV